MTLYFFERITEDDFLGPVVIAAEDEVRAWDLLGRRERKEVATLRAESWEVAQELGEIPSRPSIVYPSHYRRAVLQGPS
ncbi:MAG: hypothetical protein HY727_00415 [Candidatus Rokubacteria bacterium]|nr:hypothetical protein [Candidatus Rokubacteria bacterium]